MNRTSILKILYVIIIVFGVVAGAWAVLSCPYPLAAIVALTGVLLAPGRIQGIAWRPFFRGRRAQSRGRWMEAVSFYQQFLDRIRRRPGLKRLIWLSWGMYTRDIEAMTENNLGASHLQLGNLEQAESHLNRALSLDSANPIPHVNMAALKSIQKDAPAAREHHERALALGFRNSAADRAIIAGGSLLAEIEGRGRHARRGVES